MSVITHCVYHHSGLLYECTKGEFMWCSVYVVFSMLEDFENFIMGDFGDMDITHNTMSVMCYGNHRLLNDVYSWCECVSEGKITVEENFDGYDTTSVYCEGVMLSQVSEEEHRDT